MTTRDEVEVYLEEARQLIEDGQALLVMRPKNAEALLSLSMSKRAAVLEVARLTAANYCAGPEKDRDRESQQCWIFGCDVAGCDVYVKLVVEALPQGRRRLKILSFHQAERPLSYQF